MALVINLALDPELPLMVWADVSVVYPCDYVLTPKGRMVRATENKVHYLVNCAIRDVRNELQSKGNAPGYLSFRACVVERLCTQYGFIYMQSSTRTIIHEEVDDRVVSPMPHIEEPEERRTT